MASKYSQIESGSVFKAKDGQYRKVDDLYYEDLGTGFQSVWNPIFDEGIITQKDEPKSEVPGKVNTKDKFTVDPQTRMMKLNPDYRDSGNIERLFSEMWGSGSFDCGPEDYDFMVFQSIAAASVMSVLAEAVGKRNDIDLYPDIAGELVYAYNAYNAPKSKSPAAKKKPAAKRTATKKPATKKKPLKAAKKSKKEKR